MNFRKLLRLKPKNIGLVLSGGALRGAAHVGVLQVFEREGISPSIVAGTSVGAIIGATYAGGVTADTMVEMFTHLKWPNLIKVTWKNTLGLFDTEPLEGFISDLIADSDFCDLTKKFAAVSCNLLTGEKVVMKEGPVAPAVRASAAFPGIFSPIKMGDRLLVDGGIVDNMPVSVAKEMGADYIIAVDLSSPTVLSKSPENPIDLLFSVINLMHTRAALPDPKQIDCLIKPDVEEFSAWGFSDVEVMIARGRIAAEKVMLQLKKDLKL